MSDENALCIAKIGITIFAIIGIYIYTLKSDIRSLERDVQRLEKEVLKINWGKYYGK